MHAEVVNLFNTDAPEVKITHGNEAVSFVVSYYGKQNFNDSFSIFDQVNKYWASIDVLKQSEIFEEYRQMAIAFNTISDLNALTIELNKHVITMLDLHEFEKVRDWVVFTSDIQIPAAIEAEYKDSVDKQITRDRTYIRSDYVDLIAFSVILRTMVPIWAEFITFAKAHFGTTFKEFYAFKLLNNSKILESPPCEKLRIFIDRTIGDERNNPTSILDGISSEDFPLWILSLVCTRRVVLGDIRGLDERANLVTFIHKYITHRMKGTDIPADSIVKKKAYDEGGGADTENKLSALERYKVKHDISMGEIEEIEFIVEDYIKAAKRLAPNIDMTFLSRCITCASNMKGHRPMDPQIRLAKWIFKPVVSPRGISYLSKETIESVISGVAMAVLWSRGHKYLALLSTCYPNINENELHVSNIDSRERLSKENIILLDKYFPFMKSSGGKKSGQKLTNQAAKAIDSFLDSVSMASWTMTADSEMIQEVFGNVTSRRFVVASDIRNIIAKLVVELGSRSWMQAA